MTANPRYLGRPLLRLLECYVLWAIGHLSEKDSRTLASMTPKLRATYGSEGDWHDVVASAVKLPANMPSMIQIMWTKNTKIAQEHNTVLAPQEFAEMFVDQNLVK